MQVLFGATMIQGKNYSSEFVTSALKDQMTVSLKIKSIFFTSLNGLFEFRNVGLGW